VPTIVAASAYDLYKMREVVLHSGNNFLFLLVGFVVSFITAYISIKWLIEFLQKNSLVVFGIYRIVLAIILCAPVA
jgi:undecaprenyl-diphosphatase